MHTMYSTEVLDDVKFIVVSIISIEYRANDEDYTSRYPPKVDQNLGELVNRSLLHHHLIFYCKLHHKKVIVIKQLFTTVCLECIQEPIMSKDSTEIKVWVHRIKFINF